MKKNNIIFVRVTRKQATWVSRMARKTGASKAQVVRDLIQARLDGEEKSVQVVDNVS